MALLHAEGASASTGDTGESLATREEEDGHLVKGHIAPPRLLRFLWDGCCYGGKKMHFKNTSTKNVFFFPVLLLSATRWRSAPPIVLCANPAEQSVRNTPLIHCAGP